MATGTIQQDVIHHQNTVTLHHLGSLAQLKTDGSLFAYTVSTDNSEDLILYHSQNNGTMDFLLEGDNGGSSRESIANLLDEGLGTSLDGTDEISSSIHSTLGRNDSGVFSSDEMTTSPTNNGTQNGTTGGVTTSANITTQGSNNSIDIAQGVKKQRQKNSSPNRQGPQRCVVCGKIFSNASALTKHKLTHSDERKHACSMCGKAFKRQDHLNGHMLTHRNKKPFECRAKGCGKSYCDGRSLRRHIESRHGPEALATLTIQPTAINPPNSDVTLAVSSSLSTTVATTTSAVSKVGGTVVDHLKLADTGSPESELVMETNGVTASILGLDSNLLENNFIGQPMDIQVALQPVIVKEEQQTGSVAVASASGTPTATTAIKLEPIQITDSSQMLGLTLSTANGTLCGIVGGDAAKLRNSIAVPSSSVGNNTTAITTTTVPVTIRATHSQLHQLLTQRHSSNVSVGSTAITNASLVTLNPASVTKPQQSDSVGISYEPNWATNENEMTQSKSGGAATGNILTGESTTGTLIVGANGKCPSSPISSGVSSSSSSPGAVAAATTTMTVTTSPASAATTTPNLLKEQLELIHQIIQQAQEESNLSATANSATSTKSGSGKASKGSSKKLRAGVASGVNSHNGVVIKIEPGEDASKVLIDDKPVECTICCRRFKNTPALNGHMRLHGGYFKKDAEGKKKDVVSTSKESSNTPLQTASVSVRALIEEKIIQKRNTIQTQGVEKSVGIGGNPPSSSTPENQTGYTQTLREAPHENGISSVGHQEQQQQQTLDVNLSSTFPTTASTLNITNGVPQTFHFVYGDDNTDYLLMEEEVFNKVSSICPDSFLNGIDESILNGTGVEQLPPEWNWAATSAGVDSANSRLTSLFVGADSSSDPQLQPASSGSFTPLPPLEASFYTSPTPQSPSVNSQDSPSFMYPTPPASLESHNALQSPLFPFPSIPAPQTTPASTVVFPFENKATSSIKTNTSNLSISNPIITNALSTSNMNPTNFIGASGFNQIITAALTSPLVSTEEGPDVNSVNGSLVSISTPSNNTSIVPGVASVILTAVAGDSILTTAPTTLATAATTSSTTTATSATATTTLDDITNFTSAKARNLSGGSTLELTILTPSNSPSLGSASTDDSLQSVKELKVNEPSRMDCSGDGIGPDIFLSPNSVPNSPCFKSPTKRKQLRNTFASNLRPQTNSPNYSHFTPYPILSPVRSAPGLYWTFSPKLSHVDDSKREVPKINIGPKFQAELPQCNNKKRKLEDCDIQSDEEYRLWRTEVTDTCTSEEVEKYLEFACCSAIPGGGRNKEYALHVLNNCNGDIVDAMVVLMNPCPSLPSNLRKYKYQEKDKWTKDEISIFQEALFRYGKDFTQVAQEIEGKSREECVIFYYLWKKVCSSEYERVRNVWKKRDAAFTLELLKNVPPPSSLNMPSRVSLVNNSNSHGFLDSLHLKSQVPNQITDVSSPSSDNSAGPTHLLSHEEYPCKVCGKVFNKVKSRSAHMKSHRPPEASEGSNSSVNSKKIKIGLPVSSKVIPVVKTATLTASPPPVISPVIDSVSSVSSSTSSSPSPTNHGQTPLKFSKIPVRSESLSLTDNDTTSVNGSNNKDT